MATTRPKRKRAKISYYEADPDDVTLEEAPSESHNQPEPAVQEAKHNDADDDEDVVEDERKLTDDEFLPNKKIEPKPKKHELNKKKKKKRRKDQTFPFLSLPPELRIIVYQYLLVEPGHLALVHGSGGRGAVRGTIYRHSGYSQYNLQYTRSRKRHPTRRDGHNKLKPAVLRICHQIYDEAAPVLYGQKIDLEHPLVLFNFLADIGHANRLLLHDLVIGGWVWGEPRYASMRYPAAVLLAEATNLAHLFFECATQGELDLSHYDRMKEDGGITDFADKLFHDVKYWFRATDAAKGCKGASLSIVQYSKLFFTAKKDVQNPEDIDRREKMFQDRLKTLIG